MNTFNAFSNLLARNELGLLGHHAANILPFKGLNHVTDFHETWYGLFATDAFSNCTH